MDLGIKDKRVVITGGSRGIGAEIARHFAKEGCQISLIARDLKKLESVMQDIGGSEAGHDFLDLDLRESNTPTRAVNELISRHESIDIVVHNVGGGLGVKDFLADANEWYEVWKFNVGISIEMNKVLIPPMRKKRWGRIIHISSISAVTGGTMLEPYGGAPAYSCAKAYLNMYTKVIGRELAKDNVIVSAVMPGTILSKGKHWDKMRKNNLEMVEKYLKQYHAIGRFGKAEEIAPFVLVLASEYATFAAGSILPVDGGIL